MSDDVKPDERNVSRLHIKGLRGVVNTGATTGLQDRVAVLEDALTGLILDLEAAGVLPEIDKEGSS